MRNTRETKMIFSNVKSNKEKAEKKSASKSDEIFDYNKEIVIGLKVAPEPKIQKEKKNKKNKEEPDELDIPFENKKKKTKKAKFRFHRKENKKKNNKFFKKILKFAKWTTLILVLIGGLIFFLLSPIFNIKNINVSGNSKIPTETILSISKINANENIIKVRSSEVIKNIKQNAYIENVEILKKLPNTIEIKVQERTATFMLKIGDGYAYINNQGYILEISNEKLEIPAIIGQTTSNDSIVPGNRLSKDDLTKLEMVLKIRDTAESNELSGIITGIDISDDNNYMVLFENENKVAYIGDGSNLSTRILYVKAILQQEEGKAGEIFVNIDLNTEYPFFREKI